MTNDRWARGKAWEEMIKMGFLGLASSLVSAVLRTRLTYMTGGVTSKERTFCVL